MNAVPYSAPDQDLERLFREVVGLAGRLKSVRRQFHRRANLPVGERAVLHVLDAHWPLTASQIARRMGLSRQHVQTVLNRLRTRRYVESFPNPAHRRSPAWQLSATGRMTLQELERTETDWLRAVIGDLDVGQLRAAADLLRQLRKSLPARESSPTRAADAGETVLPVKQRSRRKRRARAQKPEPIRGKEVSPPALPGTVAPPQTESSAEELPVSLL